MKAIGYYVWIVASLLWRMLLYAVTLGRYTPVILLLCGVAYAGEPGRYTLTEPDGSSRVVTLTPLADPPPVPAAQSPTGRNPSLLWTPEQQAVWNRMRAEKHPWMTFVLTQADQLKNYPDYGEYQALAYQITGDLKYARAAWAKIQPTIAVWPKNGNQIREDFIEYVLWYDWLTPALTEAERQQYRDGLDGWARYALGIGTPQYVGGFRVADTDQTVGQYLALRMLDKLTGSKWCDQLPADVRPAIKQYCEWAAGGEWVESGSYNTGTTQLIAMGVAALGRDAEPELAKYLDDAARTLCYRITPDLKDSYLWGDEEHGHAAFASRAYHYETVFCLLAGFSGDPHAQGMIADLSKAYPDTKYPSARPWWRAFYLWSPYAESKDWRELPPVHFSPGQGVLTYKTADTLFVAHCPPRMRIDHEVSWASDFWLYQNGEWKVGHPTAYTAIAPANTLLLYGQQSMFARGWTDWGKSGSGCWITCNTSGPLAVYANAYPSPQPYYDAPPAFVEKGQRTIRFEGGKITLVDDVKVGPPQRLERYYPDVRSRFTTDPVVSVIYTGSEFVTREVK